MLYMILFFSPFWMMGTHFAAFPMSDFKNFMSKEREKCCWLKFQNYASRSIKIFSLPFLILFYVRIVKPFFEPLTAM
jgi:hypothetical protein